ncbi:TetR/AcrR family transcriptional regulator [Mangrovibacterium diazotrophicum]|uniref:TetR family transcriptional regulator n=1 Tax=Mangrovibacterium diazotrophicum TaxID=1261403 RepID=A0A419W6T0_9BACT|nr:TetR/AcrR family transcriptional regulator [Mangrovibacterium diazotrophicum]RKD91140.1 TetR family transcriptional regulator [Mangrovibacterium diazotrophicum]
MPRTEEQFEQIRTEKKQKIMEVALELFATNGFHATSMSQIAKQAGISKGLAYNYFESKNELLIEIIDMGFNEITNFTSVKQDQLVTEEELIEFVERSFDRVGKDIKHWKLFYSLMLQPHIVENFNERYAQAAEPFFAMIYQFIASKGNTDPEGDLMIISMMIEGAFLYAVAAPGIFPLEQMKRKVIDGIFRIVETGKK